MDTNRKITMKFTRKFDTKVINRKYFHRKTGHKSLSRYYSWINKNNLIVPSNFFMFKIQDLMLEIRLKRFDLEMLATWG